MRRLRDWREKRKVHRCLMPGSGVWCKCRGEALCEASPRTEPDSVEELREQLRRDARRVSVVLGVLIALAVILQTQS